MKNRSAESCTSPFSDPATAQTHAHATPQPRPPVPVADLVPQSVLPLETQPPPPAMMEWARPFLTQGSPESECFFPHDCQPTKEMVSFFFQFFRFLGKYFLHNFRFSAVVLGDNSVFFFRNYLGDN